MTDRTGTGPLQRLKRFWRDRQGGIAIIFALSATALVAFMGAGLDLSRAYIARQELSNVATMACQYSERPSVYQVAFSNNNGLTAYQTQVNTFVTNALSNQKMGLTQTTTTPYTYAALGGTGSITLTATMPTIFLPIVSINSLPVGVTMSCGAGQTQNQTGGGATPGAIVMAESFENSACSGTCWSTFQPNGTQNNVSASTQNTFTNTVGYVGTSGSEWSLMGYCLEVDTVGLIKSTVPDGSHSAELDCDNGSGTAGNSSISNKSYYTAGVYEIRYNYAARVNYPNYDPIYICGSTAADVGWANDGTETGSPRGSNITRSNQMNVYFDADNNGLAPTHTTIDGTETLAGSNLIDVCVYSNNWVQRSVKVTITTAGYYWISFAADGGNDSYGAQLDNIMICHVACSGTVNDNFPSTWNTTPLLFEDNFTSPATTGSTVNTSQVLDADYGTSNNGWPSQASYSWSTGPYNQVGIVRASGLVGSGTQALELDSNKSGSETTSRRSVSRYFYLDPGYYSITYDYIAAFKFTSGITTTACTYAPSTATALTAYSTVTSTPGNNKITNGSTVNMPRDTNAVAVFMSHVQEVSSFSENGGLNTTTKYFNPDGVGGGSVGTSATTAPDTVSTSSYNTSQLNPVLDYCYYSPTSTTRTTYVQITKAGQYYLTLAAVGASASQDNIGGVIDDVKVSAYSSLNSGTTPSFYVSIPTPGPAVSGTISYTGFTLTADRPLS